jgi:hypothetical protein
VNCRSSKLRTFFSAYIDYDGVRVCLRILATSRPIVHPPGDIWAWRGMMIMMPAEDNSWLVHQSSLAVLPAETSRASRRNGRKEWEFGLAKNLAEQYLKYFKGSSNTLYRLTTWDPQHTIRRMVCCGFLSPLKVHLLGRIWDRDPWVQWQSLNTTEQGDVLVYIVTSSRLFILCNANGRTINWQEQEVK